MKINTLIELQDAIDSEMSWRKKELSALRANINSSRSFAKETALRSGIALLYAHWEGAIKNIAYFYLVYVSSQKIKYDNLKPNFFALSLKRELTKFGDTKKTSTHTKFIEQFCEQRTKISRIPTEGVIDTKSNLNSDVFVEIMSTIGLDKSNYENDFNLIDEVLLNMRNHIAHGEHLVEISLDENRYDEIHNKIFSLINQFSIQISNAASRKLYLKVNNE